MGRMQSADPQAPAEVVVVGGGNAALCAALAAREAGAQVILLERDRQVTRGGNSKYTRNVRCADSARYPPDELLEDLIKVTGEAIDLEMARFTIEQSLGAPAWMERQGVVWQPALRGTQALSRTNRFFLGGGKALLNTYYRRAATVGVEVRYRSRVTALATGPGRTLRLGVEEETGVRTLDARAVVVASGGFESNLEWLRRYRGDAVDNYVVRGTASNDGGMLAQLFGLGARQKGNPAGFHAVAVDARSPSFDGGIVTRIDSVPLGVVVNRDARRFDDEGQDIWPRRYATWGRLVGEQPGQTAFSIFDRRAWGRFIPGCYPPVTADSIPELARRLDLDPERLDQTVREYNRHAAGGDAYDMSAADGRSTSGLEPPKSNWALPVDQPPFRAYPLRCGVTFTYLGVAVDRRARVLDGHDRPLPGVFAAGEVMAGNVLLHGYLAGFGMTIGTVFGRIAGKEAAQHARAA